jgi:protein SCO1/2
MQLRRLAAAGLLLCVVAALFGCRSNNAAAERRFPLEGRVVAVDDAAQTLTIDHREIPGYMKAMTMEYPVRDRWVFDVVHPGDSVRATLVVGGESHLEDVSVTEGRGQADVSSTSAVHLPQRGESVPDFHFINQYGRPIHLAQFRGQPLLVTFIYTRCPLPDYCVRMSGNFARIAKTLRESNPSAFAKLQMLSITLDPKFDDPKVLRAYGKAYIGSVDPELKHWTLATASPAQIRQAAEFFGMAYQSKDGQVVHNLRTALLDANGQVAAFYSGNRWKPDEVADQLQQLQK